MKPVDEKRPPLRYLLAPAALALLAAVGALWLGAQLHQRNIDLDEKSAERVAAAIGAAMQRHAAPQDPSGCPAVHEDRPLTRWVFRESDTQEPVLVCFFASVDMMKAAKPHQR